jgi:hypothetical protein
MIAIVTASVLTIFRAVALDRLNAKQQKADTVAKLGLMASKEISNSQLELIRLTQEVVGSLDQWWANIDTIHHVLLVCDVAERQVSVMESVMQAAMGGHLSVTAFTELNYARIALKIGRGARDAGLEPVARHLSDYLVNGNIICGGSRRIQHTGTCTADRHEISADDLKTSHPDHTIRGRLEIALQAVGANGAVQVDLNSLLDGHHYVTVPVMTTVIIIILVGSVIEGVIITPLKGNQRESKHNYSYLAKEVVILREAVRNREGRQEEEEESRPRKPTVPQPPSYRQPVPPPYAAAGRGRRGYSTSSPAGRPGYSLGASPSLVTGLQENEASTAGHSLSMHREQAAAMLGGFQVGRDQVPVNNFPRGAPAAIDMTTRMARQ